MKNRIPYTKPSITELEVRYASDAAEFGWGEKCYEYIVRFEKLFSKHLGVEHAIATSSCTGALHLGMAGLGIGPGDEVILADVNWIATAAPIMHLGATPILVDILPETWCIDPESVRKAITPKTKAIVAVHLYGNLCEMSALQAIADEYELFLIEDSAEAIGSTYGSSRAGSIGAFGAFSFHGTKTITTGEGGMFTTNSSDLFERVLTLSNHGRSRSQTKQFWPDQIGFKFKMSNIEAAIGCAQIERIEELLSEKKNIFETYAAELNGYNVLINPHATSVASPGYWMVNVVFPKQSMNLETREYLINDLREIGADARVFFWPLSSLGLFSTQTPTPVSYDISSRSLNLPSAFGITREEIKSVCQIVKKYSSC